MIFAGVLAQEPLMHRELQLFLYCDPGVHDSKSVHNRTVVNS